MQKRIAHYNLDSIKQLIKDSKYRITNSARVDYSRLGFSDDEVIDIILDLKANDLYKSMTSYHNNTIWQDVYTKTKEELELYIKLQITEEAIIISFKERT